MVIDADDDFTAVFAALLSERGGRANFDTAQLAAARKLSVMLSSDAPTSPALLGLLELLPAKAEGAPADLSLLTDKEFEFLDFALAKARGEPAVNPSREKRRKKSPRSIEAVRLVELLDRIAAAKRAPSELERNEIKSITSLLYGASPLPHVLIATSIASFEQLVTRPSAPAAEVEAPAVLPGNVTRLPAKETICCGCKSGATSRLATSTGQL